MRGRMARPGAISHAQLARNDGVGTCNHQDANGKRRLDSTAARRCSEMLSVESPRKSAPSRDSEERA